MSLKATLKNLNLGKAFGYSIASGATALALLDTFRLASGDISASASLAQNFISHAGAVAAGLGFAQASGAMQKAEPQPATAQTQLIMPRRALIMAQP
ncbi:MAG: hypothetical protein GW778_05595 [Alphaproteobacteria bacterium]|nr:hypothetical protein [Alphaproteobacteria bacterium]